MRRETELWWIQGKRDRETAGNCHKAGDYYAAVFFCHQSLEKAFKALIIEKKKEMPPRTHSLLELAELVEAPGSLMHFLRELTPDYITTRYPDAAGGPIADLYDVETSEGVLSGTDEVLAWIGKQLKE
jgi:HEPN domain-containing protein